MERNQSANNSYPQPVSKQTQTEIKSSQNHNIQQEEGHRHPPGSGNSSIELFDEIDDNERNGRTFGFINDIMDSLIPRCVFPCTREAQLRDRCCETVVLPPTNVCCKPQHPPMPHPPVPHPPMPHPPLPPPHPPINGCCPQQPMPPFRPPFPQPMPPFPQHPLPMPPFPQQPMPPFRPPVQQPLPPFQPPPMAQSQPPMLPRRPPIVVAPAPTMTYPWMLSHGCCTSCTTYGYYGPPPCVRYTMPNIGSGRVANSGPSLG